MVNLMQQDHQASFIMEFMSMYGPMVSAATVVSRSVRTFMTHVLRMRRPPAVPCMYRWVVVVCWSTIVMLKAARVIGCVHVPHVTEYIMALQAISMQSLLEVWRHAPQWQRTHIWSAVDSSLEPLPCTRCMSTTRTWHLRSSTTS